jgi:hypothetical protein
VTEGQKTNIKGNLFARLEPAKSTKRETYCRRRTDVNSFLNYNHLAMNYPCPIDTTNWPDTLLEIVQWDSPPDIGPKKRDPSLIQSLSSLQPSDLNQLQPQGLTKTCWSALLLWVDDLEASHDVSQAIPGREGSYLHGLMHRREPDFSNAKYWFRKVGSHPIHTELAKWIHTFIICEEVTHQLNLKDWSPDQFVDLCEAKSASPGEVRDTLNAIAAAEWFLLFDHCLHLKD